jgi:hypothetical protein
LTRPIEPRLRSAAPPDNDVVAVRGGPLTVEKIASQARDEARRHTWRGESMAAVSVFCTVDGWTVETVLREFLSTRSTYATVTVGELRRAGFEVLPTYASPHFDIVLPEANEDAASTLLESLGPVERNPYRRRR